ncbi:PREDICTED: fatty acyl-CoA reductase 1-like, partial [Eufriesea mexicana]|uniref:fatty acyl-CoA reductase 1-like n=1 Tax=Eufriesea mexicana TaxID=516756 RepID=UPI00083C33F4
MKDANRTPHPNDERSSANNCNGQIRQFYAGKHVLLTGCTGFLGTVAVEKILRTCKEISKLYIMIRQKKGKSVEERINHFFKNDIFDKLREMNPNFMEKIEVIYGDLEKEDLGLSPEDRRRLVENVNVIIHNASMVKSNEPQVYNYASSDWNPLKVFEGSAQGIEILRKNPSVNE